MSVISGAMQADATSSAADTQAGASRDANQLQYQMFQEQQKLMQPWVQSGQGNLERLNYAMYGQVPTQGGNALAPGGGLAPTAPVRPTIDPNVPQYLPAGYNDESGNPVNYANPAYSGGAMEKYNQDWAEYTRQLSEYNAQRNDSPNPIPADQMGGAAGRLSPDWRFGMQDWKDSPEYSVYQGARDAALKQSQDTLMAQGAASGMYGSGTMASALAQNMGQLYAQYDPASLAAARQAAESARTQEYNMLAGMSSPYGAQQVAQYAGQYGQNAGQNMINAGNAQAAGQVGAANAWGNAMSTGVNQLSNAYGQYRGQQNFNRWMDQGQYGYQNNVPISSQYGTTGYEEYGWD